MDDLEQSVAYYVDLLRQGYTEGGIVALREADVAVLPLLIDAFGREENRDIRAHIVHCI